MVIECNEINQTINQLKIAFQTCHKFNNKDLEDYIKNFHIGTNGYPSCTLNKDGVKKTWAIHQLIAQAYEGPSEIVIPVNKLHSYTLAVLKGSVEYDGFTFPRGTTRNVEFTTLNQTEFKYIVTPGSLVMFEYLIEDSDG